MEEAEELLARVTGVLQERTVGPWGHRDTGVWDIGEWQQRRTGTYTE